MYQKLVSIESDSNTYNASLHPVTQNVEKSTTTDFDNFVKEYCLSKLSSVPPLKKYYTPYSIGKFIACHKVIKFGNRRVSQKTLTEYLISSSNAPVKRNALYRLANTYQLHVLLPSSTWTETTTLGRKPYLSIFGFNELVKYIQEKTSGGIAMPISKIKTLVKQRIHSEWKKLNKSNNKTSPSVSMNVLHSYATRIISQNVFNVHATISTKTETRSTAEWSYRSVISFAMCVAVTHFSPEVSASPFHRRKKGPM